VNIDQAAVAAVTAGIVAGAVEGWRRVAALRTAARVDERTEGRVVRLGTNLGPRLDSLKERVSALSERIARLEGQLRMQPPPTDPTTKEGD
jgi:hypothetical protein